MAVLAVVLCLPVATLAWLGLRPIEQNRALSDRRALERREQTVERTDQTLTAIVNDSALFTVTPGGGGLLTHSDRRGLLVRTPPPAAPGSVWPWSPAEQNRTAASMLNQPLTIPMEDNHGPHPDRRGGTGNPTHARGQSSIGMLRFRDGGRAWRRRSCFSPLAQMKPRKCSGWTSAPGITLPSPSARANSGCGFERLRKPTTTALSGSVDEERGEVRCDGERIDVTPLEYALARTFVGNRGRLLSRNQLIDPAWGRDTYVTERVVDAHIMKLHRKLAGLEIVGGFGLAPLAAIEARVGERFGGERVELVIFAPGFSWNRCGCGLRCVDGPERAPVLLCRRRARRGRGTGEDRRVGRWRPDKISTMTPNRRNLDLLLDRVEVSVPPYVLWQPAIRIANGGDEREAEGVRIRCWDVIDAEYRGRDIPDPDVSGLRAAICMLDMKQSVFAGDFFDNVDYFLTWANFVEDHTDDQIALFRKHFGQFLADE